MAIIDATPVHELLRGNDFKFEIPDFQRDFSWTQDQWGELEQDLTTITKEETFFLGALIILTTNEVEPKSGEYQRRQVVDGQQRLVTLTLLWKALSNVIYRIGTNKEQDYPALPPLTDPQKDEVNSLRFKFILPILGGESFMKGDPASKSIKLNEKDEKTFNRSVFTERAIKITPKTTDSRIIKCFSFWLNHIGELVNHEDGVQRLQEFVDKTKRMTVTQVVVDDDGDAYEVFERLNARGAQLSAADLLKNRLLQTYKDNPGLRKKTLETWNHLVKDFDSKKGSSRFDIVDFIYFYWQAFEDREVTRKTLYKKIKARLLEDKSFTPTMFLKQLEEASTEFVKWTARDLVFPTETGEKLSPFAEINTLKYRSCYPAFLAIQKKFANKEVLEFAGRARDFLFRTITISEKSVHHAEEIFKTIVKKMDDLEASEVELKKVVEAAFDPEKSGLRRAVNDKEFEASFKVKYFGNDSLAKYVLTKVYQHKNTGEQNVTRDAQLEHVLPQGAEKHWSDFRVLVKENKKDKWITAKDDKETWDLKIDSYIYNIGNMTLLLRRFNIIASNRPIKKKLKDLEASEFYLTEDVVTHVKKTPNDADTWTWTAEDIESRAQRIVFDNVTKIWKQ